MRSCGCTICHHCAARSDVTSWWLLRSRLIRESGWSFQFCARCGSRWTTWHWLEQRVGLMWRRTHALNPGTLDPIECAEFIRLKHQAKHTPVEVR